MRVAISTMLVLGGAIGVSAIENLSEFIVDIPSCSYSTFRKAVEKEGCNVKDVNADTLRCICKHVTSIAVTMASGDLDANCIANFSSAIAGTCAQWDIQGTSASDIAAATKALASELAGKSPGPAATGTSSGGDSDASAEETSTSEAPAAAATPIMGLVGGAAALAAVLI